ncbi:hypothetical protein BDR05DRAFT_489071 [Suillus weaverae]|nr:hypothetical protein BDR05DRAFT_489071 [Suillus weaverae]
MFVRPVLCVWYEYNCCAGTRMRINRQWPCIVWETLGDECTRWIHVYTCPYMPAMFGEIRRYSSLQILVGTYRRIQVLF